MNGLADVVKRFVSREPNMDEGLAIEWVLDAAQAFVDGKLPWYEAAKIGAVSRHDWRTGRDFESTAYARFLAILFTPPDDPRRAAVVALCTELVEQSGAVLTGHGLFNRDELAERNVVLRGAA